MIGKQKLVPFLLMSFWLVMGSSRMELGADGRLPSENISAILRSQGELTRTSAPSVATGRINENISAFLR